MRRRIDIQPSARVDLDGIVFWLRSESNADTARRFARSATATFRKLAGTPGLGAPADAKAAELADTRRWRVQNYPNWLIFYRPTADGIAILRVLHAAQDWRRR